MFGRTLTLAGGLDGGAAERTTAATDVLLAVVVAGALVYLRQAAPPRWPRRVWAAALVAFGVAAALGAAAHGVVLSASARSAIWHPLYLSLGTALALVAVGAVVEWRGERSARRALPGLLAAAGGFYAVTLLAGGDFRIFIAFEAAVLVFALGVYAGAAGRGKAGAGTVTAGLAVSLAAGVVQAAAPPPIQLVWMFDHNGLYHLVQLAGVLLLVRGVAVTLRTESSLAGAARFGKRPADVTARGSHVPD